MPPRKNEVYMYSKDYTVLNDKTEEKCYKTFPNYQALKEITNIQKKNQELNIMHNNEHKVNTSQFTDITLIIMLIIIFDFEYSLIPLILLLT